MGSGQSEQMVTEENGAKEVLSMQARLSRAKLTPKDKVVLDYIWKNQEKACFMTASELAGLLGVSASTVVRVSARLGFESYSQMKRALQEELAARQQTKRERIPYEKIEDMAELDEDQLIEAIRKNALRNVETDLAAGDSQAYRTAADLVAAASRVYVVGHRACAGLASALSVMLGCVRSDVQSLPSQRPMIDSLIDLTPQDAVILIGCDRYSSDTVFAGRMAREAGSRIVALTDQCSSPLCQGADAVIFCSAEGLSFYNSYAALMMAMEVLTGLVSRRNQEQNETRLKRMEEYLRETGQY